MTDAELSTEPVAALDLGSNSFHLIIARWVKNELQVLDKVREQVRLADGLDDQRRLSESAQARAIQVLERMGQRLRNLHPDRVRAVGTNTMRSAKNAAEVRERFQSALGHPIEVVAGREEARLIYLGVLQSRFSPESRLVVDIGGGSTEVILGQGYEIGAAHSLHMGCITYTRKYFPDGVITKENFRAAETAARLELRAIEVGLRERGWEQALGASGTIHAVREILRENQWSQGEIHRTGLKRLRKELIEIGHVDKRSLPGLKRERAPVFPGGVAILRALFRSLKLETMEVSPGALREGLLHDLIGRIRHADVRDSTITRMAERNHVDLAQAARVERTALKLMQQLPPGWAKDPEGARRYLVWAARLHEIGLAVSYTGFHKHGAYLVEHSDMPGFSEDDQIVLATLVGSQRRKLSRGSVDPVPAAMRETVWRLILVLRLALLLNRSRESHLPPTLEFDEKWAVARLTFPFGWRDSHPLTLADLEQEGTIFSGVGIKLCMDEALQ